MQDQQLLLPTERGCKRGGQQGKGSGDVAAQPGGAAQPRDGRQPCLGWGDLGAARAQEPPQLTAPTVLLLTHVSSVPAV